MIVRLLAIIVAVVIATPALARDALDYKTMASGKYRSSVDLSAYAPGADARPPTHRFEGRLQLSGKPSLRTLVADKDYLTRAGIAASKSWIDDFDYAFVQHGDVLIPQKRGPIRSSHAWWEVILEPGRVWDEPGDQGYTRAAIPFALTQKNSNCAHNGVLMILFNDTRIIDRAAMQISSETCLYLQRDMWGWLKARYTPQPVANADALVAAYEGEVAARLPTKPLSALASEFDGFDVANLITAPTRSRTRHGVVYQGIHYVSRCPTRHGDYPYCDVLDVPSYSVAKSAVAGVALMRMEKLYPGTAKQPMSPYVPATGCRTEAWQQVYLLNLLDMDTGHYDSATYMADEDAEKIVHFFNPEDYAHKLAFSCEAYPRVSAAGKTWVYHTTDTYLLGVALNNLLKQQPGRKGQDIFSDVLDADIYAPLKLSPTARTTRRTYDDAAQPFFGWGLFLHADDIAKLGQFIGPDQGAINGRQLLDPTLLDQAMQRDPQQRGLQAAHLKKFRYQHSFWARNLEKELGCDKPTWIPFMSGFGGILVVMLPNGAIWYSAADDGELPSIDFAKPAIELARLGAYCNS
ncbi:MAG TPA: serine hydrolase [Dokdonella sp.]|uniref:serine hydrolase n=1 Tax=Dokdonella sp. TaxID=2291710 RepID=UPI002D80620D|nr:serine hydrolase [Dokdonella sp.]HET9032865.1 serine hydrolase [Dokdonella sp.]